MIPAMKKHKAMRIMIILFVIYQIWVLFLLLRYPSIGINLEKDSAGQWMISNFDSTSIKDKAGLAAGDRIVLINGSVPEDHPSVLRWNTIDQADSIRVSRDGVLVDVQVTDLSPISASDVVALLAECFSLVFALVIYRKAKNSPSAIFLSAVFLDIGFIFLSLSASIRGDPSGKFLINTFMMLLPPLFFHFFNVFLREKGSYGFPDIMVKGYMALIALPLCLQLLFLFGVLKSGDLFELVKSATLVISALGILGCLAILIRSYIRHRHEKSPVAMIIKTVFWALFCSMAPVILLSFAPRVLFGHEWVNSLAMSCFIFIFPLTFVYLLATRRLYDIDLITRRMYLTTAIALFPSLMFTGIIRLLFRDAATGECLALVFVILLCGTSFVLYSLENLITRLEPALFPRKYRLQQALKKIARNLGTISSFQEMREIILKDIAETLEIRGAAILFVHIHETEMITLGEVDQAQVEELITAGLSENAAYTCFEITRQEEFTAYLAVSAKRSGAMLGLEEIQWLQLILTYLAVSLENVQLIRMLDNKIQSLSALVPRERDADNVRWFRKLTFSLQEKERTRIAMDIHDSIMQDLFFLKRRLQNIQGQHMLAPEGQEALDSASEFIDMINAGLRQSCFELHPYLLRDIGLVGALNKLFQTERTTAEFRIEFAAPQHAPIEEQDMEMKQHIFRMIQELLNNAKKYSRASELRFSLDFRNGFVLVDYADNGVGFEEKYPAVREIGSSGRGLEQLKSRVLSMDGIYELHTAPGKGVRFTAQLPASTGRSTAQ